MIDVEYREGWINHNPLGHGYKYPLTVTVAPWYRTDAREPEEGYSRPFAGWARYHEEDGVWTPSSSIYPSRLSAVKAEIEYLAFICSAPISAEPDESGEVETVESRHHQIVDSCERILDILSQSE